MEGSQVELNKYVIKEFAYGETSHRHHFINISTDKPQLPKTQQIYPSYFTHLEGIIEYYRTHYNEKGNNTVADYIAPVYTDELKIDIDEIDLSLPKVQKLLRHWESIYDIDLRYLKINFSGSKGFHIRIPSILFGDFIPSESLPDIHKKIAAELTAGIVQIDESVYKCTGLFRDVNSINSKSGLYAIPLTNDELFSLSYDEIKELAKEQREIDYIDPEELEPIEALESLKEKCDSKKNVINFKQIGSNSVWQGTNEGNRFKDQATAIGKLIRAGLSNEDIMGIGLLLNNQNNPPKEESLVRKQITDLIKKYAAIKGKFWKITKEKNEVKVEIMLNDYIKFLEDDGFTKLFLDKDYIFTRMQNNICSEFSLPQIKDHVLTFAKSSDERVHEKLIDHVGKYLGENLIECVSSSKIDFKRDYKDKAFAYYKNGFIELKKNSEVYFKTFEELESPIWESSILQRNISPIKIKYKMPEYERFLRNVVRGDEDRFLSLCSAIGYLLHDYKDKSNAKAVILCDEKISEDPNGRTGKSLIGKAISHAKNIMRVDGKNFEFKTSFTFQLVSLDTKVFDFNDVKANFDFERLFSVITDDMIVEYKNKQPFPIKFEESPKIMISTNYTIKGMGASYRDRMFEIEFSDYYNEQHKPNDDFGHLLFDEWDEDEWNRFDNFMLECLQLYLDEGLISCVQLNLNQRKLIDETSAEFIKFSESYIQFNYEYDKEVLVSRIQKVYGLRK